MPASTLCIRTVQRVLALLSHSSPYRHLFSEWMEFTDGSISQWTCGRSGQVVASWSQSRPAREGMFHFCNYSLSVISGCACSVRVIVLGLCVCAC